MSRIGNTLLKETAVKKPNRLKVVESPIDSPVDGSVESVDQQGEKPAYGGLGIDPETAPRSWKPVKIAIAVGALAIACVTGSLALRSHRTKAPSPKPVAKTTDYAERFQLSIQAFKARDYNGALKGFKQLLAVPPASKSGENDATLLLNIGMTYKEMGDLDNARKFYQAAIQADQKDPIAYNNMAMLQADEGDLTGATGLLEKAILLDPRQPAALLNLGKVYEESGQWALASLYYSKYVKSAQGDPSVKERLQTRIRELQSRTDTKTETKERTEQ